MKITICGSMQHEPRMAEIATRLEQLGYQVEKPNVVEGHVYEDNLDANATLKRGFIDEHFRKIDSSEAILVVNETKNGVEGYVGGNTLIEIAYAYSQGLDIFLLNPVPALSYADEINGMHPIILHGDVAILHQTILAMPLVYMSTESALKHSAVSRAFRKAGLSVRVEGKKVDSGVNEQPMTMEETYEGALNRHGRLLDLGVEAAYYATVESGLHSIHKNHSLYGCTTVVVQPSGKEVKVGLDVDIEFPQEMLDKVPSEYADHGVLVQELYGYKEKDPLSYISHGKVSRRMVIESAMYRVLVQLDELRV